VPTLTSEDSRTIWEWGRGGDYNEVEYFTKAYTEEVADVLYSKTQFQPNQAIHTPYDYFHAMPTQPCENIYKRDA
jgi:hypothetical protein